MDKERYSRHRSSHSLPLTVALLLVICLIECTTAPLPPPPADEPAAMSSQSGSCLSYGHSCWGAHGKRSGKPAAAPDWFLNKLFRRMDTDLKNGQWMKSSGAIYPVEAADNGTNESLGSSGSMDRREPEAKPMLDDKVLANIKLWQIMREAAMTK